ncbi:MAG: carboxylate-amine ligase [Rhodospirillales bacterium]
MAEPRFTVGIEEEYLLVERESRNLATEPPEELMQVLNKETDGRAVPEFLRAQVEIATKPCQTIAEAAEDLCGLRRAVAEVAERYDLALMAAATHPFASWSQQHRSQGQRYEALSRDLQSVAHRLLTCGMHVHVGLDDDELRIDLMGQVAYFLPHLLALSTSSPFWRGRDSGLKSYRIAVFDEMPRTGLPESFESWSEYQRHLAVLVDAGVIEDASKVWWDVRPSTRFPTLEMRIADICTYWGDTITLAAVYTSLLRMLYRLKRSNQRWRRYSRMLVEENRWRAQRYGTDEGMIDFGRGEIAPFSDLLEEILALIAEDAEAMGCTREVLGARDIVRRGSSAHSQRAVYAAALAEGAEEQEALKAVVDWLVAETVRDL